MRKNKWRIIWIIGIVFMVLGWIQYKLKSTSVAKQNIVHPVVGNIQVNFSTTATILPRNRLEIRPPVNGRIEKILVKEGDHVKAGDVLALLSSTERAALLDAARGQGEERLKYWQDVYKPITLAAPIDGEVIVSITQPGQMLTANDAVIILSDRLIVRAQVDETDIGKINIGKKAGVSFDAYPDTKIDMVVDHVYYESKIVNNVTIYQVDLAMETVPPFFRSGMSAIAEFLQESRKNVLLLPVSAVGKEKAESFVMVESPDNKKPLRRQVQVGLRDDKNVEILSGVTANDNVIVKSK